jgi:hypothetical protein
MQNSTLTSALSDAAPQAKNDEAMHRSITNATTGES